MKINLYIFVRAPQLIDSSNDFKKTKTLFRLGFTYLLLFFHFLLPAQNRFSIGLQVGQSKYSGDLFSYTQHISYGGHLGYDINKYLSLGISYNSTKIEGNDSYSDNIFELLRNLEFTSKIREVAFNAEITPFVLELTDNVNLSPFGKLGFGMYKFNPQAELDGVLYDLNKLCTEGQGLPGSNINHYQLIDDAYLIGLGLKFSINKKLDLKLEITQRLINNDYLDDVSGYYYNLSDLEKYISSEAAKLSYRNAIALPGEALFKSGILKRGDSNNTDTYFIKQLAISYRF